MPGYLHDRTWNDKVSRFVVLRFKALSGILMVILSRHKPKAKADPTTEISVGHREARV